MTVREGRESRNAGSFLRKELGGALRNTEELSKDLTLFLRRLKRPFPRKEAKNCGGAATTTFSG